MSDLGRDLAGLRDRLAPPEPAFARLVTYRHRRRAARLVALGLAAVLLFGSALFAATSQGRPKTEAVRVGPSPPARTIPGPGGTSAGGLTPPKPGRELVAVAAGGPGDVWAAGEQRYRPNTTVDHTLVEHWDGSGWIVVDTPDVGTIISMSADAPADVWALGTRRGNVALHWNGATWRSIGIPNVLDSELSSISALGPHDVWAAGTRSGRLVGKNTRGLASLVEHWDGSAWHVVPTPSPGERDTYLQGIVAISPRDVWAAGYLQESARDRDLAFTLHWDGRHWSSVPLPQLSPTLNVLWGIGTDGAGGAWTVGHYEDTAHHLAGMIYRWTGTAWVVTPVPQTPQWSPTAIAGSASDDVWALGSAPTSAFAIGHWDGVRWSLVVPPFRHERWIGYGLAVASSTRAWAVGTSGVSGQTPFIEQWDGARWRPDSP